VMGQHRDRFAIVLSDDWQNRHGRTELNSLGLSRLMVGRRCIQGGQHFVNVIGCETRIVHRPFLSSVVSRLSFLSSRPISGGKRVARCTICDWFAQRMPGGGGQWVLVGWPWVRSV